MIINHRKYFLQADYWRQNDNRVFLNLFRAEIDFQGPKALILSPTRELAIQIHQEVQKYSYRGIRRFVD